MSRPRSVCEDWSGALPEMTMVEPTASETIMACVAERAWQEGYDDGLQDGRGEEYGFRPDGSWEKSETLALLRKCAATPDPPEAGTAG